MVSVSLNGWRIQFGLSTLAASRHFGLSERQYKRIESGECPLPPYVPIIVDLLKRLDMAGIEV